MSWFFKLIGSATGNIAEVDSNNNAKVNLPTTQNQAGFIALAVEEDTGVITGTRTVKKLNACEDGRLNIGWDTTMLSEVFPGATLNSTIWTAPAATMTVTVGSNFLTLNAGLSTAIGAVARVSSYRSFPAYLGSHVIFKALIQFGQSPVSNNITEFGLGIATGTAAPTDGVFFRFLANGEFRCIVNVNGTETQSGTINFATFVGANITKKFEIQFADDIVYFYIGEDICATINLPTAGGSMSSSQNLPILFRTYNTAATGAAQTMKVGGIYIGQLMQSLDKEWADIISGGMGHASQGQTGQTLGTLANYANSANPTAAVPTNTNAALGSGLGGQFWETDTLAVTTDGIISSYQVPVGSATAPGKSLYVTGIGITSYVQTVLVGGPYVSQWSLAYGHTAVSLATTEAPATKAPRRFPLPYTQAVTAAQAVNTKVGVDFYMDFKTPICVQPGEFIQLVKKKVGTAPTGGVIAHVILINGYWE